MLELEVHRQAVEKGRQMQNGGRSRTTWNPQAQDGAHDNGLKPMSVLIASERDGVETCRSWGPLA